MVATVNTKHKKGPKTRSAAVAEAALRAAHVRVAAASVSLEGKMAPSYGS